MQRSSLADLFNCALIDSVDAQSVATLRAEIAGELAAIRPEAIVSLLASGNPARPKEQLAIAQAVVDEAKSIASHDVGRRTLTPMLKPGKDDFEIQRPYVEIAIHLLSKKLSRAARCLMEVDLLETVAACDAFAERSRIGTDSKAIAAEVVDGVRYASEFFKDEQSEDLNLLQTAIENLLDQWSGSEDDFGIVVDVEFARLFLKLLVAEFCLDIRLWTLLLLRLDRAFTVRAPSRLNHAFGAVVAALVGAVTRFDFLRDIMERAVPYCESGLGRLPDILPVLTLSLLRPEGQLHNRICRQIRMDGWRSESAKDFAQRCADAQRLAMSSLREKWERNYLDTLSSAFEMFQRVTMVADAATTDQRLLENAISFCNVGSSDLSRRAQCLLTEARRAVATGHDVAARRELFRLRTPTLCGPEEALWEQSIKLKAIAQDAFAESNFPVLGPDLEELGDLLDQLPDIVLDLAELDSPSLAAISPHCEFGGTQIWPSRCFEIHRVLTCCYLENLALAELRGWCARYVLGSPLNESIDGPTQALHAWHQRATRSPTYASSRQCERLRAFCAVLPQVGAGVKIVLDAEQMSVYASAKTLTEAPEYAERIATRGRASTMRDNHFTLLRLGQVLGGPTASPKETMTWWWLSTIGMYLVNRDEPVMQDNLRNLAAVLRQSLNRDEFVVAIDVLVTVYRKALSIGIPKELYTGVVVSLDTLPATGPLWSEIFDRQRQAPAHHSALSLIATDTLSSAKREIVGVWKAAADGLQQHGDIQLAWAQIRSAQAALLTHQGLSCLERDWFELYSELPRWLTTAQTGFWIGILDIGLDAVRRTSLGRSLASRKVTLAQSVAGLLPSLAEGDKSDPDRHHKCVRDQQLLLNFISQALTGSAGHLSSIEICRFLTECVLPYVQSGADSWNIVLDRLSNVVYRSTSTGERQAWDELIEPMRGIASHASAIHRIGNQLFASPTAVFSEDPELEAHWRQLVSGLLVSAAALEHGAKEQCFVARVLLSSPLIDENFSSQWEQVSEGLVDAMSDDSDMALTAKVSDALAGVSTVLDRCAEIVKSEDIHGMDVCTVALADSEYLQWLWKTDRWVRSVDDGLTTPMPGDMAIAKATDWQCPDMLALRQTQLRIDDAQALIDELEVTPIRFAYHSAKAERSFAIAFISLALETAAIRDGVAFKGKRSWVQRMLNSLWNDYRLEDLLSAMNEAVEFLDRLGSPGQELLNRVLEVQEVLGEIGSARKFSVALSTIDDMDPDLMRSAQQGARAMRLGHSINAEKVIAGDIPSSMAWLRTLNAAFPESLRPTLAPLLDLVEREDFRIEVAE